MVDLLDTNSSEVETCSDEQHLCSDTGPLPESDKITYGSQTFNLRLFAVGV